MRRVHLGSAAAASCLLLLASASPLAAATPAPVPAQPTQPTLENFDPTAFSNPTNITNQWLPLRPGTHWVWEGEANVDGERIMRRVELTVTDLTKVIDGVRTVVAYELDFNEDQLIEAELIFFAQDDHGDVWHLGQYPEEYDQGVFVEAPAWIHGYQGANAGIMMHAFPQLGTPSYSQGWGPAVDWTDRGQLSAMGQRTCVRIGCFNNVLVVTEFSLEEPNAQQLKSYAPGVGNVQVGWAGAGEIEQEVLMLVRRNQVDAGGLAAVRNAALALENHAYEMKHEVYKYTLPTDQAPA